MPVVQKFFAHFYKHRTIYLYIVSHSVCNDVEGTTFTFGAHIFHAVVLLVTLFKCCRCVYSVDFISISNKIRTIIVVIVYNNEIGLNNCYQMCPSKKRAHSTHTFTKQANRMKNERKKSVRVCSYIKSA